MSDDLSREVGRLDGRLGAVESRQDRFETSVWEKLASMDGKLDAISTSLAENRGQRTGTGSILHWLVTMIAMAGGLIYPLSHLFGAGK